MSKDEFLTHLKENGYTCAMSGTIPTILTDDMGVIKSIKKEAKSCGYEYSFAVKLGKSVPQALLQA